MKNPKFQIFTGKDKQFYFRLLARNGQNILSSEAYTSKSGVENGVESVKKNAGNDARFKVKESKNGAPYFVLVAANGEPIGKSETYSSKRSCARGIAAVQRAAPVAGVEDTTG